MTIYYASICVDVSHGAKIEADSMEEAVEKAWEEFNEASPGLCHHCSNGLDMGDPYRLILSTDDGEVYDDDHDQKQIRALVAERDAWKAYAEHQEHCRDCAESVHSCEEGSKLGAAARGAR